MENGNNYMRSRIMVVMDHPTLSDKRITAIMRKIVKAAKGRSGREASAECGGLAVWTSDEPVDM